MASDPEAEPDKSMWIKTREAMAHFRKLLLCSKWSCAGPRVGDGCSVCFSPAWVKDVHINRQISNITQLFLQLEAVLCPSEGSAPPTDSPAPSTEPVVLTKKKNFKIWFSPKSRKVRCQAENAADSNPSAPQCSDPSGLSVFNFTSSSQDSSSSTPPRVRAGTEQKKKKKKERKKIKNVVRKQVRGTRIQIKEKKMRLEAVNQQWGFGKDDAMEDEEDKNEARSGKRVSFQCPSSGAKQEEVQDIPQGEKPAFSPKRQRRSILKDGTEKPPDQALSEIQQPPRSSPKRSRPQGGSPESTPKRPRLSPGQRARRRRSGPSPVTSPYSSIPERSVEERKEKESPGNSPATGRSQASPAYMKRNHKGETPLHLAAIKGDVEMTRELLEQGADPNLKDHAGWTPLHEACNLGHVGVVELLLQQGALINTPGYDNDSPLHDAVRNGHTAVAKVLLRHGASTTVLRTVPMFLNEPTLDISFRVWTPDNEEAGPSGDRAERQAGERSGVGQSGAAGGQNTDQTTAGANALSCSEQTGTADFQMKNWEGVVGKVCAKLSQWTWVLPQLSYRGRVLVTNNLIASLLWHRFTVLEPPEPLIKVVQKRIVTFFWAGQHWTRASVLYLPLQEGGQGLIDLSCWVRTFRLQAAQRLLYGEGLAWAYTAYTLLRRMEDLNYDKHLFVLNLREMDLSATTLFYQSVLRAWSSVLRISRINAQPFPCTEEEPLFHNPLIQSRMISSLYIQQCFRRAGITRVKDLMSGNSWKTARELCAETGVLLAHLMQRLLGEVASALPSHFREALGQDPGRSHQPPPPLSISAAAGEYHWEKAALLSFQMPILTTLEDASKKALYETCVKVACRGSLAGLKESHWNISGLRPVDYAATPEMREVLSLVPEAPHAVMMPVSSPANLSKSPALMKKEVQVTLIGSKLTAAQQNHLTKAAGVLGAKRVETFSSAVTHVMVPDGPMPSTLTVLQGILSGCWVLSFTWLDQCLQQGHWIEESGFEAGQGPQRSRANRVSLLPPLFNGCFFYLLGSFHKPPRDELVQLVRAGGGQLLSRQPKADSDVTQTVMAAAYHARPDSDQAFCTHYVLYDPQSTSRPGPVRLGKVWSAPTSWLLDCIRAFSLLPVPEL
ncbi:hypothetical protein QTP70_002990 [Hemibagrus guttatus]|uniref:BRCT domain-containing protein n=1 Tax=Hemibagrus guttatus TaxID=175788 RepID=A0AAE0V5A4_9TELE|nr:hypothetical protein QTP70_002990 [Hemibagrus guttatus]